MTDKMIEEMAFDLIKATSPLGVKDLTEVFDYKKVATDLCNLWNWRKILEGSVVLSEEEYEGLQMAKDFNYGYHEGERNMEAYYENIKLPKVRKEAVKQALQELYEQIDEKTPKWVKVQIEMKAKKFGVEVEE